MGKASTRAQNKYIAKAYDRVNLTIPKGRKQAIEAYAAANDISVNGLINMLLRERLGLSDQEWKADPETKEPD